MTFPSLNWFILRFIIVCSFCLLLCNCGNKSALFLEASEQVENRDINKLDKTETEIETNNSHSEVDSPSKGEQTP
ncbi:MAG: hypothetical protein COA86_01500 [Kangiella sp.]|nr:MAG: hypothetical protein COA86_01500 [Kangiella sp.]